MGAQSKLNHHNVIVILAFRKHSVLIFTITCTAFYNFEDLTAGHWLWPNEIHTLMLLHI